MHNTRLLSSTLLHLQCCKLHKMAVYHVFHFRHIFKNVTVIHFSKLYFNCTISSVLYFVLDRQERRKVAFRFYKLPFHHCGKANLFLFLVNDICYKTILYESVQMLVNFVCMLLKCLFRGHFDE